LKNSEKIILYDIPSFITSNYENKIIQRFKIRSSVINVSQNSKMYGKNLFSFLKTKNVKTTKTLKRCCGFFVFYFQMEHIPIGHTITTRSAESFSNGDVAVTFSGCTRARAMLSIWLEC